MARRLMAAVCALFIFSLIGLALSVADTGFVSAQTANPWNSQFYGLTTFINPIAGANPVYPVLDMSWTGVPTDASGVPVPGVPADNFSVIFTSTQTLAAGTYRFRLLADDSARLIINGQEIIPPTTPNVEASTGAVIGAGTYTFQVNFVELTGNATIRLQWGLEGTGTVDGATVTPAPTAVPTRTPLPPIPPGALTATVVRASVLNIRDAPSTGGNRLGRVLRGETYAVVGRDDDARWFLLQLGGYQGWAYGYYLFVNGNEFNAPIVSGNTVLGLAGLPDTGVRVQARATLRLRAAPTTNAAQTGRVVWGSFLPVVGRNANNTWFQVVWRGTVGWVYAPFVQQLEGDLRNVPIR